jgi:hypothetical protein
MYLTTGQALKAQGPCAEALRLKPGFEEARILQAKIENELKAEKARGP